MGSTTLHNKFQVYYLIKGPESNPKSDQFSQLWGIALYNQLCEIIKEQFSSCSTVNILTPEGSLMPNQMSQGNYRSLKGIGLLLGHMSFSKAVKGSKRTEMP